MHSTLPASVSNWIASAAAILLLPVLLPGTLLTHVGPAIRLALIFGALNALVRPFMRYVGVPESVATYALFSVMPNVALALWATVGTQAIFFVSLGAAYLFVGAVSTANAYIALYADVFTEFSVTSFAKVSASAVRTRAFVRAFALSFARLSRFVRDVRGPGFITPVKSSASGIAAHT